MHLHALAVALVTCLTCVSGGVPAMAQTVTVHPAQNSDPDPGPPGDMPYEMAGRPQERAPLVTFDDLSGWEVVGRSGLVSSSS